MNYTINVLKHNRPVEIILDTETTGLDSMNNKLLSVQVAVDDEYYVFQMHNEFENETLRKDIRRLIDSYSCTIIIHNAKFDLKFLIANSILQYSDLNTKCFVIDTMLLQQIRTGLKSDSYSLAAIYKKYFNEEIDKSVRESFTISNKVRPLSEEELKYAGLDVVYLSRLWNTLKQTELSAVEYLECFAIPAFTMMELTGMKLNVDGWINNTNLMKKEKREIESQLDQIAVTELPVLKSMMGVSNGLFDDTPELSLRSLNFNWNSSKQVIEIFRLMGINCTDRDGKESVSSKTLVQLRRTSELVKLYLKYKELNTKIKAFGDKMLKLVKADGRIHCEYRQIGAETGRVSCKNPNLQNIPARDEYGKRFRECFISGNGRSFIVADYSQAEIRIVAALSKSDTLITALNNNEDPYSTIATVMFNKPVSKTENKNLRDIAKSILLGLNYGMGASKLSETINCSLNEAKAHITKFRKANPNLVDFLDRCNKYGVRNRVAYSMRPFSRPRFFDVPRDESEVARIGRQSQNHPIQSTNADITKYALVLIYNKLNDLGLMYDTRIVNTVHDEIIVETSDDRAELVCKIVEECMTKAGNSVIDSVNMSSTANISKKWDK